MSDLNFASPFSTHVIAIGRLMEWLRQGHQVKMDGTVNNRILTLDDSMSQRFAFGFPKRVDNGPKPQPFLGIQRTERAWMHPMQWKGAYVKANDRRLYFVTAAIASNDDRHPDLPSFAIGITVNDPEKLTLLFRERGQPRIEGREMWIDEGVKTRVNFRSTLFSMPLVLLDSKTPIPLDTAEIEPVESLQTESLHLAQMQNKNSVSPAAPSKTNKAGMSFNTPK